jgi:multidrug efflux pump subunit AcrA (membrane-fusion protein)
MGRTLVGRRLSRRGWALTAGLGVALLVAVPVGGYALTGDARPKQGTGTVARVQRGTVSVQVSAAGTVEGVDQMALSFGASGVVTELNVKAGDLITAGQVLARIDDSDARTAVDAAQSAVAAAQEAVDRAQAPTTAPTCTTTTAVRAAAVLPGASGSPSASPAFGPSTGPSPVPSRSATVGADPRPSGTGCAGTGGTGAGRGGSGGTDPVFAAQQQLNNADLALVQARLRLAGTVITAPAAGRVLSVAGTVGSRQSPGGTGFIVLNGANGVAVRAQFSEADVAHLALGQPARVTLPSRAGSELTGRVSGIDPAGTRSGRLVRYGVEIVFDAPPTDLLFGQSATVAVVTASADGVLYAPSAAVRGVDGGRATVTVHTGDGDVPRTVEIGLRGDQYTEIRSGLSEGDLVVV